MLSLLKTTFRRLLAVSAVLVLMLFALSYFGELTSRLDASFLVSGGTACIYAFPMTLSGISPSSAPVGSSDVKLYTTVNGGLADCSVIAVNGSQSPTTWEGGFSTVLPANLLSTMGTLSVTVVTPSVFSPVTGKPTSGFTSNALPFTVTPLNPAPVVTQISPVSARVGSGDVTLNITGSGFIPSSTVNVTGTVSGAFGSLTSSFVNSSSLTAVIPATVLSAGQTLSISVTNLPPGGGISSGLPFTVVPAIPTISGMTPTIGLPGTTFIMAVTGTSLIGATAATFSGSGVSSSIGPGGTPTSATLLVTILASAQPGSRTVTITTPTGTSSPFPGFSVLQPRLPLPPTAPQTIPEVETGNVQTGYALITPDPGSSAPLTTLTFGTVQNGVVQTEAGVVPTDATTGETFSLDFLSAVGRNLGLAVANPAGVTNSVTVTLRDDAGSVIGATGLNVGPYKQISMFVNELFPAASLGQVFLGSVSIQSGTPFALLGLRFSGADFSTLSGGNIGTSTAVPTRTLTAGSVAETPRAGIVGGVGAILLPQFAMGGGWATQITLVNTSGSASTGRIDIFDSNGQPLAVRLNGTTKSTFTYSIPAGGTFLLAPRDQNGQSPL